jgi:hypothetical protein
MNFILSGFFALIAIGLVFFESYLIFSSGCRQPVSMSHPYAHLRWCVLVQLGTLLVQIIALSLWFAWLAQAFTTHHDTVAITEHHLLVVIGGLAQYIFQCITSITIGLDMVTLFGMYARWKCNQIEVMANPSQIVRMLPRLVRCCLQLLCIGYTGSVLAYTLFQVLLVFRLEHHLAIKRMIWASIVYLGADLLCLLICVCTLHIIARRVSLHATTTNRRSMTSQLASAIAAAMTHKPTNSSLPTANIHVETDVTVKSISSPQTRATPLGTPPAVLVPDAPMMSPDTLVNFSDARRESGTHEDTMLCGPLRQHAPSMVVQQMRCVQTRKMFLTLLAVFSGVLLHVVIHTDGEGTKKSAVVVALFIWLHIIYMAQRILNLMGIVSSRNLVRGQ